MARAVETILNSDRSTPSLHEVTPCSEYSRFTVEGVLADPLSPEKNAVFEPLSLGATFRSSRFREKRWSDPLAYGMAFVEEDVRIHLQGRGKIIIRRSPDREAANRLYMEIADIMWPSLYCSIGGHTMAESVQRLAMVDGGTPPRCFASMLEWPYGSSQRIDQGKVVSECAEMNLEHGRELVERLLTVIGEAAPAPSTGARIRLWSQNTWSSLEKEGYVSREEALGTRSYFIMADRATNGVVRFLDEVQERPDRREVLLSAARSILAAGFSGDPCPRGVDDLIKEPDTPIRHIWRAVSSLDPGSKDLMKVH